MQKHTLLKGASVLAVVAALFFAASSIVGYMANTTVAWFPALMALAWFLIAGLFYQRARRVEHRGEQE
jgi:hypothetical protein